MHYYCFTGVYLSKVRDIDFCQVVPETMRPLIMYPLTILNFIEVPIEGSCGRLLARYCESFKVKSVLGVGGGVV